MSQVKEWGLADVESQIRAVEEKQESVPADSFEYAVLAEQLRQFKAFKATLQLVEMKEEQPTHAGAQPDIHRL